MNAELMPAEPEPIRPLTTVGGSTPARLIEYAMQQGADMDRLEKLMELQQRWEANEARKDYHLALAGFKAEPLSITKDKRVYFPGKDGKPPTEFHHATLGNVVGVIAPALAKHRMSHSWDVRREGDRIFVTCKLTHAHGHSEGVTLDGPLDTTGSKNNIQSQGSTITYLQRYTLLALTGLATEDQDDDGRGSEGEPEPRISAEQEAKLRDVLSEAGADLAKFCEYMEIDSLSAIAATQFQRALSAANAKLRTAKKAGGA